MFRRVLYLFSIALLCAVQISRAADPEDHLVLSLPFDEGDGTTTEDKGISGLEVTLMGSYEWTEGKLGQAVLFTGGRVDVVDSDPLNLPLITVMAWVNPTAITANVAPNHWTDIDSIYAKAGSADDSVRLALTGGDGVHFYIDTGNDYNLSLPDAGVQLGEWQHVAGTFDGTTSRAFLNGEQIGEMAASGTIITNTNVATVAGGTFRGAVDEMKIFDRALTLDEVEDAMYGGVHPFARSPDPADGAIHEDTWVNLNWKAGDFAVSHDVYLGDSFSDVDAGIGDTFRGNQTSTFYVAGFPGFAYPDGLVPGTTYYWRIDEVNDADPNSPWKGDVWSFSIPPKTAYNPIPADGTDSVALDSELSWTGGFGAKLHMVYFGDDYDTVSNAAGGTPQAVTLFKPASLEREKVYYWRVDESDGLETHKGDIWSFATPGAVGNPEPANGAINVQMTVTLGWTPADNAASGELYFGTDRDAVKNAITTSTEYIGPRELGSEDYDPGKLAMGTTYYWRVDSVYPDRTVKGLLWSFTTADFLVVDDFESYNDIDPPDPNSNRIFDVWIDGFLTTDNGALVGNDMPPYAEQTIVHGGAQSMPYSYDNANKTSEATLTLVSLRNWTQEGVTKLSLWFRGGSGNAADRLFVTLNDNAVAYHDDARATQITGWNEWVINLAQFASVDITNVDTITIGIGTKDNPAADGGAGKMYFDDIRLVR